MVNCAASVTSAFHPVADGQQRQVDQDGAGDTQESLEVTVPVIFKVDGEPEPEASAVQLPEWI